MIRINIIPHRENELSLDAKIHLGAVVFIVFITLAMFYITQSMSGVHLDEIKTQISSINSENTKLKKEIGKIRDIAKVRKDVEHKLFVIDSLQDGRTNTIRTLNDITKALPEGVWITDVIDTNGFVYISGVSRTNELVAEFMRKLEISEVLRDVSLTITERKIINNLISSVFSIKIKHEMTPTQKLIAEKLANSKKHNKKAKHVKVK